jgi:argininosuccinate synthase
MSEGPVVLAFSGGLDTSWCVPHLRETLDRDVVTVTVDTGGFDAEELEAIMARARDLGAAQHLTVDGRQAVFDRFVRHLVAGNCLRGGVYPLCVAAERIVQAEELARCARELGADTVAHGSTGAGNDQVRFDVALAVLLPDVEVLAPVRKLGPARADQLADLAAVGLELPERTGTYSVNRGLWGTTIGGGDLHDPAKPVPADCWADTLDPAAAPAEGVEVAIGFETGVPSALDGKRLDPVELVSRLGRLGAEHGVGRGIHTGDTILGIKGRLAFEAPAATALILAHRELEKLVLTKRQQEWKDRLGAFYAGLVHEALSFDPVARDVEAFLTSTQRRVTGTVRLRLVQGRVELVRIDTRASLLGRLGDVYGEKAGAWDGAEAAAFAKLYGLPSVLAARRDRQFDAGGSEGPA